MGPTGVEGPRQDIRLGTAVAARRSTGARPAAPDGPILGAYVPGLGVKEALLADAPEIYFTIPHFDGHAVILVRLERIEPPELAELLTEAWLLRAPKRLAARYLHDRLNG